MHLTSIASISLFITSVLSVPMPASPNEVSQHMNNIVHNALDKRHRVHATYHSSSKVRISVKGGKLVTSPSKKPNNRQSNKKPASVNRLSVAADPEPVEQPSNATTTSPAAQPTQRRPANNSGRPSGSSTGLEAGKSVQEIGAPGSFMSESSIEPFLLEAHNRVRSLHADTPPLTWSSELANFAKENTRNCEFKHTDKSARQAAKVGENIAFNTHASAEDMALKAWYGKEVIMYDFNNPGFRNGIGHMTQMVWKKTTQVGCAVRQCGKGMGLYVKCNYSPQGNFNGQFEENVARVVGASSSSALANIVENATGFRKKD